MFYNTEILTSRKGGFAVFWLAATIGSKGGTGVKKLTRAEVLKSSITKACEKVIEPDEPLALRLSSNLMMGIARVYQQQYLFYAADVQHVHQSLKKAITEATLTSPDLTINVELPLAPLPQTPVTVVKEAPQAHGIDLPVHSGVAFIGFNPDLGLGGDWRLPDERQAEEDIDLGEGPGIYSDLDVLDAPAAARKPKGAYQAREADITLQEPQLDDYLLQGVGGDDIFPTDDFGGEQPVFGETEEGLLYGVHPELDAVIRASSAGGRGSKAGSGHGSVQRYGPSSSAVGADVEMGAFSSSFQRDDYGGGYEDYGQGGDWGALAGETAEERVRREHEEARARLEGDMGMRRSPTPMADVEFFGEVLEGELTPSSATRKRLSDALQQAQTQQKSAAAVKKATKPKKPKKLPFDPETELDDEAFRKMRDSYHDRMAAEREKADKAKKDKEAHQRAMELVFQPPAMFAAVDLADFWKTAVTDQMPPFEGGKKDAKKRRLSSPSAKKKAKLADDQDVEAEKSRRAGDKRLSEQPQQKLGFGDEMGDFFGQDFGGGFDEVGRAEGEYGGGFEQYFEQDVEQGRAGSEAALGGSQRQSMVPWAQEAATSEGGFAPFPGVGGPSSQAGGTRVSLDTPLRRETMQRSRAGSMIPSVLGSTPHRAHSPALLAERDDEFAAFEGARLSRSGSPHPSGADSPFLVAAALETESYKFLNFARRQHAALPNPDEHQLLFSDIVPEAATNKSTAAQAFYLVVALATKGLVRVGQDEPYGEIAVDIL
ncbi:hypothetical protein JCM8097_006380 [Rhodosporidiobolus ruineniae]